jgi:methyl-accepting chemotaxis protein
MAKARDGLSVGQTMHTSLGNIVSRVVKTADTITEIAVDSQNQAASVEQVNTGLRQISDVVLNTTATAEQSASASQEMAAQASFLQELVSKYKFGDNDELFLGFKAFLPTRQRA